MVYSEPESELAASGDVADQSNDEDDGGVCNESNKANANQVGGLASIEIVVQSIEASTPERARQQPSAESPVAPTGQSNVSWRGLSSPGSMEVISTGSAS